MWAHVIIVGLSVASVTFLGYFEFAMARELRRSPKQWRMISRLRTNWSQDAVKQRIVVFRLTTRDGREKGVRAAR